MLTNTEILPPTLSIQRQKNAQYYLFLVAIVLIFTGFAVSRAMLSMGTALLILNSAWPGTIKTTWSAAKGNLFVLSGIGYFLLYVLSGLWSEDTAYWQANTLNKLPFLLLPFAMLALPFEEAKFRRFTLAVINLMLIMVICYSLVRVMDNYSFYKDAYAKSKPIPTNSEGDHIRFSICLAMAILLNVCALMRDKLSIVWRTFAIASIVLFSVYLHILAAKSGLMALYIIALSLMVIYFHSKRRLWIALIAAPLFLAAFAWLMYVSIGTFQQKVNYILVELEQFQRGERLDYNYSDNGRIISYQVAWLQIQRHPLMGVGAGDTWTAMRRGYSEIYPEVPDDSRFIPVSQIFYDALALGLLGTVAILLLIAAPIFAKGLRAKRYLLIAAIVMAASLMVESMLQIQYGVFIYIFFTMIWYKWLLPHSREQGSIRNSGHKP